MLEFLKKAVCQANLDLVRSGLVIETWGNVSGIDRERGCMVIKPSGVAYGELRAAQMVVVGLADGKAREGKLKPSSDTATHLALYRAFAGVGGVAHTHSLYATAWAQARRPIPPLGTTHADYFHGEVPCTRELARREIKADYELNTGRVIIERLQGLDPLHYPGVLVAGHGPFAWGADAGEAGRTAVVLEFVARLASETVRINPKAAAISGVLLDKHFFRKHGAGATYGQGKKI
jgi:L-ribulose-5-phosphate 4-epimerase